jgi:hypothetical protein
MDIALESDFPVTDEACKAATGKTLAEWSDVLIAKPEFVGKRREAVNWMWDQFGRDTAGAWWGITIWVEHERRIQKLQKDGRIEGYGICSTKTIAAPVDKVMLEVATRIPNVTRIREGKDIRGKWQSNGADSESELDVLFAEKAGKTGVTLNHNRIQTRPEADGLRKHWSATLDEIKRKLEGS